MPQSFEDSGFQNVISERHPFPKDIATFLLDTFMLASQEISENVLDPMGEGQGQYARHLIHVVEKYRRNIGLSLDRLMVVGQKPKA